MKSLLKVIESSQEEMCLWKELDEIRHKQSRYFWEKSFTLYLNEEDSSQEFEILKFLLDWSKDVLAACFDERARLTPIQKQSGIKQWGFFIQLLTQELFPTDFISRLEHTFFVGVSNMRIIDKVFQAAFEETNYWQDKDKVRYEASQAFQDRVLFVLGELKKSPSQEFYFLEQSLNWCKSQFFSCTDIKEKSSLEEKQSGIRQWGFFIQFLTQELYPTDRCSRIEREVSTLMEI